MEAMATTSLEAYYRSLLRSLERSASKDNSPPAPGEEKERRLLVELVKSACSQIHLSKNDQTSFSAFTWKPSNRTSIWILPNIDRVYALHLLRQCIVTEFKVTCRVILPSIESWRGISEATEIFNRHSCHMKNLHISFSVFVEELFQSRSELIADRLLHCSHVERITTLVKEESVLVNSFVAVFNSNSSLLDSFSSGDRKPEHISLHPSTNPTTASLSQNSTLTATMSFTSSSAMADCKVKKHESETVTRVELVILSEMWKNVAACLRHRVTSSDKQSLRHNAKRAAEFLPNEKEFEAARNCLLYLTNRADYEEQLVEWDRGYQELLALALIRPSRKSQTSRPAEILHSSVIPPLQRMITSHSSVSHLPSTRPSMTAITIDSLRHYHSIITPITLSIHTISHILTSALNEGVGSSNLSLLAEYVFSQGPETYRHLYGLKQHLHNSLPSLDCHLDSLHMERRRLESSYGTLQTTFTDMCEGLEKACNKFHDLLRERCRHCLQSVFPSAKYWKTIGKQGVVGEDGRPSGYCETLIEQLLGPLAEVALILAAPAQSLFLSLSLTIFFTEYRHFILANKLTYRVFAGKQLLRDFQYLFHWITADGRGLNQATLNQLRSLSIVSEMERGLQVLSGTKVLVSDPQHNIATSGEDSASQREERQLVRGLPSLPVWTETAWHNLSDWQDCIL